MFGAKSLKVCCGPRCGSYPGHRAIYDAIEAAAETATATPLEVLPTMCRGFCGDGVTVIAPNGDKHKARDTEEARRLTQNLTKSSEFIS